jgi:hypothetical protein
LIADVTLDARGDERRILIAGEEASLFIETSLATGEIHAQAASTTNDDA